MRAATVFVGAVALCVAAVQAQQSDIPRFEAASIKPVSQAPAGAGPRAFVLVQRCK